MYDVSNDGSAEVDDASAGVGDTEEQENNESQDNETKDNETSGAEKQTGGFDMIISKAVGKEIYAKEYLPGTYTTYVIVFEGKVAVADYTAQGPKIDLKLVEAGQSFEATNTINAPDAAPDITIE